MITEKQFTNLEEFLRKNSYSFAKDYGIKYNTYFKMGGQAKFFLTPLATDELVSVINYLRAKKLDYKLIGFTSNVIFLDEIDYSIIISTKNLTAVEVSKSIINVEAGYSLQDFVRITVLNQAKGFEGLEGIPASIGGALVMNAGAYNYTISDNLKQIKCIDENGEIVVLDKDNCDFSYRNSIFKSGKYIILQATFELVKGNRNQIANNIEKFHIARHSYQDFVYPNLGSMISVRGNNYNLVFKKDKEFYMRYWFLKLLYKNPVMKFINRKKPNNKVFNRLLIKYLSSKKNIHLNYTLSTKNANILINDGSVESMELIDYIFMVHSLIGKKHHIENEIILNPAFQIKDSFKNDYQSIINKIKVNK